MFLKCIPSVFVINNDYEILILTKTKGVIAIKVGGEVFYEENTGVLSSEKNYAKIRIPQALLDSTCKYEVLFRETINRKAYFSQLGDQISAEFVFKPLTKEREINVYHVADVHHNFSNAEKTCSYFGDDLDLLVVNGDIGELESEDTYFEIAKFVGNVSKGKVPVLFVRGNHDTRGKLVEKYTEYFPANSKNTFFTFNVGCLTGVALDCGEDKLDTHEEYGGVNDFSSFRKRQTDFLTKVQLDENKIKFAITHICPCMTTYEVGGIFDIERETYEKWTALLERENISFMLCGHFHKAFILEKDDEKNIINHNFPIIVGSELKDETVIGTAIVLSKDSMVVRFTDMNCNVLFERRFYL